VLADRVRAVLAVRGLTVSGLGKLANVRHPNGLRALRAGRIQPRLLKVICEATGLDERFFLAPAADPPEAQP